MKMPMNIFSILHVLDSSRKKSLYLWHIKSVVSNYLQNLDQSTIFVISWRIKASYHNDTVFLTLWNTQTHLIITEEKKNNNLLINPFPNNPWFLRVWGTSLLKTLWEKEKLLVTSNFSFSHKVFYPSAELSAIFIKFEIVVCKHFEFGRV